MSPAQAELLRRCIEADRLYRSKVKAGDPYAHRDERGVEIGSINGTNSKTARVLEEAGLIETVQIRQGQNYAFLGKYNPYDEI